ncbi:helix-turn-helix transcriptional regulator [Sulfitobacter sp. BSw21498]|uniref:helix-turn-helix transcriptional regulator n=1 Tax=Sulfitobacter sp. BSw21498 TaxID=664426 RepID=UPI0011101D38|nr:helix-turn-helix transcriptional regulator [Sulfitobacter sp. BSw21498]
MNKRGSIALWVIAALQATVALFFTFCFVLDALGLEPAILTWQSHEYQQTVLAIGLNLGVALGWIALKMSLNRARLAEEKMQRCTSEFSQLMAAHFAAWGLTPAERDVALFLIKGLSTRDIAEIRGTSEGTIKAQTNAIYRKAGVTGRTQLLSTFIEDLMDDALLPADDLQAEGIRSPAMAAVV